MTVYYYYPFFKTYFLIHFSISSVIIYQTKRRETCEATQRGLELPGIRWARSSESTPPHHPLLLLLLSPLPPLSLHLSSFLPNKRSDHVFTEHHGEKERERLRGWERCNSCRWQVKLLITQRAIIQALLFIPPSIHPLRPIHANIHTNMCIQCFYSFLCLSVRFYIVYERKEKKKKCKRRRIETSPPPYIHISFPPAALFSNSSSYLTLLSVSTHSWLVDLKKKKKKKKKKTDSFVLTAILVCSSPSNVSAPPPPAPPSPHLPQ